MFYYEHQVRYSGSLAASSVSILKVNVRTNPDCILTQFEVQSATCPLRTIMLPRRTPATLKAGPTKGHWVRRCFSTLSYLKIGFKACDGRVEAGCRNPR